jgi:hypothetical protein
MTLTPISQDAVDLMLQGTLCLSAIESNGIRIDVPYLKQSIKQVREMIIELEDRMKSMDEWRIWKSMHKNKTKITSRPQLSTVLFGNIENAKKGNLGYTCKIYTDHGAPEISEISLQDIDLPFCKDYVKYMSLQKLLSTNLKGIANEIDSNGILHPSFNLNTVRTYRSSSGEPNFQNFPNKNKVLSKIVRQCFIARPGNHFVEVDYSGAEVRCNSCINNDPKLIQYIMDSSSDMHKDMAIQIFKLTPKRVTKSIRNIAKGGFVFASFYGSWWKGLAEGLWDQARVQNPETADGVPLMSHLESVGLKKLGKVNADNVPEPGSFYEHIKNIERDFWENRFAVYNQWKKDTWARYLQDGYIETPMGFRCSGVFTRNEILNIPAQSCLRAGSRVQTKRGLIPIEELVNEQVEVWTGFRWAPAIGRNMGKHQLARITLSSGLIINCDVQHKLKNENREWVDFDKLKIGDYVALPNTIKQTILNNSQFREIYRFDTITKIEVLDEYEDTYTMSVDDPLHQFVADGVITKNSAFHCLLWSLIQIQEKIKKYNLKTLLIGQIHDSIVADSPADELDIFLELAEYVMTKQLRKRWSWIIVPMEVEADVADIGKTWFDKKPYTIK